MDEGGRPDGRLPEQGAETLREFDDDRVLAKAVEPIFANLVAATTFRGAVSRR